LESFGVPNFEANQSNPQLEIPQDKEGDIFKCAFVEKQTNEAAVSRVVNASVAP
jgi:hypothetical protein